MAGARARARARASFRRRCEGKSRDRVKKL